MNDIYKIYGHENYSCIKELHKISEDSGIGIYEPHFKWKNNPEENCSFRIIWEPKTKDITAIDPPGGPFISAGFELGPCVKVMGFTHDGNFGDVKVIVENSVN